MLGRVVPRGPPGRRRADHRGLAKEIADKSERIAHAGTISPFAPDGKPPSGRRRAARGFEAAVTGGISATGRRRPDISRRYGTVIERAGSLSASGDSHSS